MTFRCPVCRAENTIGPTCRRCRANLSLLAAVEARREFHFTRARAALRDGNLDAATSEIAQARAFRDGSDLARLRAWLFILKGDFGPALAIYRATR